MRVIDASAKHQHRCQCNKGKDAAVMTATMPAQQQWRCQCNKGHNDARYCNEDKDAITTRAKTPAQGWQRHQCNKGKDTSKTIAKTPVQRWCISRRAPQITFCEVSHQLLRFLKCLSSCPLITWDCRSPPSCPPHCRHLRVPER